MRQSDVSRGYFSVIRSLMWTCIAVLACPEGIARGEGDLELAGLNVVPHLMSDQMRYAREPNPELGARVQVFLRNNTSKGFTFDTSTEVLLRGKTPGQLVEDRAWSWHDFPNSWPERLDELPPGSLTVWTFNGIGADWGVGTLAPLSVKPAGAKKPTDLTLSIDRPETWISAITFLSDTDGVEPNTVVVHVTNDSDNSFKILSCRLWLPKSNETWRTLYPSDQCTAFETWPDDGVLPPKDSGILRLKSASLPLSYAAIEVEIAFPVMNRTKRIWGYLRVKRESFDISGGWVSGSNPSLTMTFVPFLKTLRRMHVNTAHIADNIPGYTDQTGANGLFTLYPLKFFNSLLPMNKYEQPEVLPRVHAVEFLGEPQYGGGRPVPPMEVWQKLAPYQQSKLPTSLTHSEERIWRYYAGLSDFPHYDAYRVCAPSPDAWFKYDRWDGKRIGWGAPLETIGDMCRSLRELNRPMPTAYWSQGPHEGWGPMWGRRRASPTPNELRMQAYHALASRITSLYWFNLSLPSIVKYRDTLDVLTRVGREIGMLSDLYLAGNAYRYMRLSQGGHPDWDLSSIVCPEAALLFVMDLDYYPDQDRRVFQFHPPREARFTFELPSWLRSPEEVFRVDADGTHSIQYELTADGVSITDTRNVVGIYVVSRTPGLRKTLDLRRLQLLEYEESFAFDPANNDEHFAILEQFVKENEKR